MTTNVRTSIYILVAVDRMYPSMLADPFYEGKWDERDAWSTPNLPSLQMRDALNRGHPLHEYGMLIVPKVDL